MSNKIIEPVAHMLPSVVEECRNSECNAHVYSVEFGNPMEESVPLYTGEAIQSLQQQLSEAEADIAFLQSCVNSGERAEVSDRPSQRAKHSPLTAKDKA